MTALIIVIVIALVVYVLSLRSDASRLQADLDKCNSSLVELRASIAEYEAKIAKYNAEIERREKMINELTNANKLSADTVAQLQSTLSSPMTIPAVKSAMDQAILDRNNAIASAQAIQARYTNDINSIVDQINALSAMTRPVINPNAVIQAREFQSAIDKLKSVLNQRIGELEFAISSNTATQAEITRLKADIQSLQAEIAKTTAVLTATSQQLATARNFIANNSITDISDLRSDYERKLAELNQIKTSQTAEIAILNQKIAMISQQLSRSGPSYGLLPIPGANTNQVIGGSPDLVAQIASLQQEITDLRANDLKAKADLAQCNQKLIDVQNELQRVRQALETAQQDLLVSQNTAQRNAQDYKNSQIQLAQVQLQLQTTTDNLNKLKYALANDREFIRVRYPDYPDVNKLVDLYDFYLERARQGEDLTVSWLSKRFQDLLSFVMSMNTDTACGGDFNNTLAQLMLAKQRSEGSRGIFHPEEVAVIARAMMKACEDRSSWKDVVSSAITSIINQLQISTEHSVTTQAKTAISNFTFSSDALNAALLRSADYKPIVELYPGENFTGAPMLLYKKNADIDNLKPIMVLRRRIGLDESRACPEVSRTEVDLNNCFNARVKSIRVLDPKYALIFMAPSSIGDEYAMTRPYVHTLGDINKLNAATLNQLVRQDSKSNLSRYARFNYGPDYDPNPSADGLDYMWLRFKQQGATFLTQQHIFLVAVDRNELSRVIALDPSLGVLGQKLANFPDETTSQQPLA